MPCERNAAAAATPECGLNIQLATVSTTAGGPVSARVRLRRAAQRRAKGAGRMLAQTPRVC